MELHTHHMLFILSVIFLIVEIFTFTFVGGAVSIGFVFSGIANFMEASVEWQILWFIIGCAVGFFSIKHIATKYFYPEDLETNSFIGRDGVIVDEKKMLVSGQLWNYKAKGKVKPGTKVTVLSLEGSTLLVKSI